MYPIIHTTHYVLPANASMEDENLGDKVLFQSEHKAQAIAWAKHHARTHHETVKLVTLTWEECEHGLSAWLCAGPGHYPQDM